MFAAVVFNIPSRRAFDYLLPSDAPPDVVGRRVLAPLAERPTVGVVVAVSESSRVAAKAKPLVRVFADMPPLPAETLELARFCASYYQCPLGRVIAAVMPTIFRRSGEYASGGRLALVEPTPELPPMMRPKNRLPMKIVGALAAGPLTVAELTARIGTTSASITRVLPALLAAGAVTRQAIEESGGAVFETEATEAAAESDRQRTLFVSARRRGEQTETKSGAHEGAQLTPPQERAFTEIQSAIEAGEKSDAGCVHLLLGKTGSGKTEIYLRLIERALAAKRQALALTPEIHLTPQFAAAIRRRFSGRRILILHSDLNDNARAAGWLAATRGEADVVVGTRLAVFTPMPRLGLIIVDEEHDPSFRQDDGFSFSARDLAVWRARRFGFSVVLGSATPSLETYHNALGGKYGLTRLEERFAVAKIDPKIIPDAGEKNEHGLAPAFIEAARAQLAAGKQGLIFINRRGYAPALVCRACATAIECDKCSARMVAHRTTRELKCHRCAASRPLPLQCPQCGGELAALGHGTQRIEEGLARVFPQAKIARADSDSLSRRGKFEELTRRFDAREIDLLVGTQIISKGHNFPNLGFVGVLGADGGLWSSDFRAAERLFAQLSQVGGRGTRGEDGCEIVAQTAFPDHPLFAEWRADDVEKCWQRLLEERRRASLPPFSFLAVLRARGADPERVEAFLQNAHRLALLPVAAAPSGQALARQEGQKMPSRYSFEKEAEAETDIEDAPESPRDSDWDSAPAAATESTDNENREITIYEPTPDLIAKISNEYRFNLLFEAANRADLRRFLRHFFLRIEKTPSTGIRWRIDVDPVSI